MTRQTTERPLILVNSDIETRDNAEQRHISVHEQYIQAIADNGGLPLIISPSLPSQHLREMLFVCNGFLFIGGNDYPSEWYGEAPHPKLKPANPERSAADRILAEAALALSIPLLGICGGHQLLNIVLGGKLIQHIPNPEKHTTKGDFHDIDIKGGCILSELFGTSRITVNSYHHQAVMPDAIAPGLTATAYSDDGIIEAIEGTDPNRFILGVQWHPERMADAEHRQKIFGAFIAAAKRA